MKVYLFDHEGVYIGTEEAFEDPRTSGHFLLPPNGTLKNPNEISLGQGRVPRWQGQSWVAAEDHRGEIWYNTETDAPVHVSSIDQNLEGFANTPRPDQNYKWENGRWKLDREKVRVQLKMLRDALLTHTDFVMLSDAPFSPALKIELRDYRQALRDMDFSPINPDDIIFPEVPDDGLASKLQDRVSRRAAPKRGGA